MGKETLGRIVPREIAYYGCPTDITYMLRRCPIMAEILYSPDGLVHGYIFPVRHMRKMRSCAARSNSHHAQ
jgi:hypothetical protein